MRSYINTSLFLSPLKRKSFPTIYITYTPTYTQRRFSIIFFLFKNRLENWSVQKNVSLSLNQGMFFVEKHTWLKKSVLLHSCSYVALGSQSHQQKWASLDVIQSKSQLSHSELPDGEITLTHWLQMEFREIKVSKISKPSWIFPKALLKTLPHDFNAIYLSFS